MSENLDNPNRSKETDSNQSSSNQKSQWPSSIESNPNPHRPQHKPASPNWVDKCTLIVLVLAFSAAVAAAIEAHRLVTATDRAIEEARTGTGQQIKVLQSQLSTQQTSLEKQISLLDLSTRPILTSNFADWQLNPPLKAGISPTISFSVKNFERSNAQLLSATYQYTIAPKIPVRFGEPETIKNFPGLLPPEISATVVVSGLPSISTDDFQAVDSGKASVWLRAIFIFRDDSKIIYEIRFTGAYSKRPDATGGQSYGFVFPDNEVPRDLWYDTNFDGLRCLNAVASEPHNFGCGDPQ